MLKTMFIKDQGPVATGQGSNGYRAFVSQILDLVPESPTIVGAIPPDIHMPGTSSTLIIFFWWGARHGFQLNVSNSLSHNT